MAQKVVPVEEVAWMLMQGWMVSDEMFKEDGSFIKREDGNYIVKKKKPQPITSELVLSRLLWPRKLTVNNLDN